MRSTIHVCVVRRVIDSCEGILLRKKGSKYNWKLCLINGERGKKIKIKEDTNVFVGEETPFLNVGLS